MVLLVLLVEILKGIVRLSMNEASNHENQIHDDRSL